MDVGLTEESRTPRDVRLYTLMKGTSPLPCNRTSANGSGFAELQTGKLASCSQPDFAGVELGECFIDRFDDLMWTTQTRHPDCVRIWKRLDKHCDELFTFLDDPQVPADCESSIWCRARCQQLGLWRRHRSSVAVFRAARQRPPSRS